MTTTAELLYTPPDLEAAYAAWGCNCGPAAVAALLGLSCAAVRPHFPGFEARRYSNPTHVRAALASLGRRGEPCGPAWPAHGLVFIQWGGPWDRPGVPIGAAYRHTHWIAVDGQAVFDVNVGYWVSGEDWRDPENGVAAWLTGQVPRGDGTWRVRTALRVEGGG